MEEKERGIKKKREEKRERNGGRAMKNKPNKNSLQNVGGKILETE